MVHHAHGVFDLFDYLALNIFTFLRVRNHTLVSSLTGEVITPIVITGLDNDGDKLLDSYLGNISREIFIGVGLEDNRMTNVLERSTAPR